MSWITGLRSRLRHVLGRTAVEERMHEEFRFHAEMETEKNLRAGMSPEEARRHARIAFGAIEAHKEELRDGRRLVLVEDLTYDIRYAARSLRRDALWTALAILIVGLGIGASVTVFSPGESCGGIARRVVLVTPRRRRGRSRAGGCK